MKKVTMQDIANQLGISKNSVSQALGNKKGVSQQTREDVLRKSRELGYHYSQRASTVVHDTSKNFPVYALLATEFVFSQKSFFGEIILGIENEIRIKNGQLKTFSVSKEDVVKQTLPKNFDSKRYRGLFILSHIEFNYIKKILDLKIPTILIDHHDPHFNVDCVLSQNKSGAFLATEYLIGLGHQKIGFIGDIHWSPSYEERWEGYKKALNLHHLPYESKYVITTVKKEERTSLFKTLDGLLNPLSGWPTAWLCVNSGLGFILISYFQSKGLDIPKDASVCCFDNTEITLLSSPQITTMGLDLANMGRNSVNLLEWRINHTEDPYVQLELSTQLIKRESTGKLVKKDHLVGNNELKSIL